MNCQDVAEKLNAYLDGELGPQAAALVREHLEGCAQCAARLRELEGLNRAIGAMQGMPTPAGFARRVRLAAATGIPAEAGPAKWAWGGVLSRVAAMLVAATGIWVGVTLGSTANSVNGYVDAAGLQEDDLDLQVGAVSAAPAESVAAAYLALLDEGE